MMQYNFFILSFLVIENILVLFYHSFHIGWEKIKFINKENKDLTIKRFSHKINKFNTKISTHYRIVCLYSINISDDIFVSYEFFIFFWNMFNSKPVKNMILLPFTFKAIH